MKRFMNVAALVLLSASCGFCTRDAVFIGLTGEGAPSIEKSFTRHFQDNLAMMPDVRSMNSIEVDNLRERTSGRFSSATMTPALYSSLKRFVTDSTYVIWGRVKECVVKPERFWYVGAGIRGTLTLEISVYDFANRQFIYIGNASSTILQKKWFILWWPVDNAIEISARERTQLIDELELKSVTASSRILSTIMLHERIAKREQGKLSSDIDKRPVGSGQTMNKKNPADSNNEEPTFIEDEPTDFEATKPKTADQPSSGVIEKVQPKAVEKTPGNSIIEKPQPKAAEKTPDSGGIEKAQSKDAVPDSGEVPETVPSKK